MTIPKRTRLSPHDRKMQLLDCTRTIVLERGLSSFTMEALARQAQVSNPLIYKYFDSRILVLQELLIRESTKFDDELESQISNAKDYREFVTSIVSANFVQFSDSNIINILKDQPDVRAAIAVAEKKRYSMMIKYLVKMLRKYFSVDRKQAEQLLVLASGASTTAAAHYNQYGGDKEEMIENTANFIFGGIEALLPNQ